uniref:Hydrophobic protein OSR8 n=1 Tax=Oryza brachyantha TaxID=4533 RepID=J3MBW2_ORYBR
MGLCSCCCRCLEILCAILLPPLGVCLRHGCCTVRLSSSALPLDDPFPRVCFPLISRLRSPQMEFWISVLLTLLGYLPGVLYAVYVIVSVDPDRDRDRRRRVDPDDYIYVA